MFREINGGNLPTRGSKYSACVDLYANADITIGAGETVLIPLGVCIDKDEIFKKFYQTHRTFDEAINEIANNNSKQQPHELRQSFSMTLKSHYLQLMLRSSLSKELIIANGVGVIDLDYKDEIMIRVHKPLRICSYGVNETGNNHFEVDYKDDLFIKKGQRVAQITLLEHKSYLFGIDGEEERDGGFGNTGK